MIEINKIYNESNCETLKRMDDCSIDMIVTSPPYPGVSNMWGELFLPENYLKAHAWLNIIWDECLRVLKPGCKLAINIANTKRRPYLPNTHKVYEWAEGKCEALGEIIWHKGYGQNGTAWGSYCNPSDPSLADQHEYILIFRKEGERQKQSGYFISAREFKSWRNSVWNISPAKASEVNHVAPFPLEIPKRLIMLYSYPDEIIYDPFMGSGTTAMAAVKLSRNYVGSETVEEYYKLAEQNIKFIKDQFNLFEMQAKNSL